MNPEEAKKKWCPMYRRCDLCVADLCAVWVWDTLPTKHKSSPLSASDDVQASPGDGHCGLVKK